ncbi:RNA-binding protein [bacterium CG17_big_fil_post_rev_8_21_14_2_50_64_8]|nr:MAG: RNA-binding protein [bacterium CG17_big_fil_post_rev_8_21_14_2_50_64_8]PJA76413.1 MAG: RNA-binding protein [bacterium CG_4_9_14_3_um_filter_65_15]
MTIYVGNLAPETTEQHLRDLFAGFGPVDGVTLITDPASGRLRGFGFVEMEDGPGLEAVSVLDGTELLGSVLRVNEARDRGAKPPRRAW